MSEECNCCKCKKIKCPKCDCEITIRDTKKTDEKNNSSKKMNLNDAVDAENKNFNLND